MVWVDFLLRYYFEPIVSKGSVSTIYGSDGSLENWAVSYLSLLLFILRARLPMTLSESKELLRVWFKSNRSEPLTIYVSLKVLAWESISISEKRWSLLP